MTTGKTLLRALFAALALFAATALQAAVVQPCLTAAASSITVLPINGGGQTYCQTAFGWSDTWFAASQPATYNLHQDVLSGDNAPSLFYTTATGTVGSGNFFNFISPFVDGGTLNAQFIGSNWTVVNDITVNGNVGTSDIALGGLALHIVTTVGASGITEDFTFTNNTGGAITGLFFDDYYNFHANGSQPGDIGCPTTTYAGGVVTTTGSFAGNCSPIVQNGSMFGSQGGNLVLPDAVSLDFASLVLLDIANGLPYFNGSPCTGDCAADLLWNLGALANGGSVSFTINKNFERIPEPATLGLLGLGLVALRLVRRRG